MRHPGLLLAGLSASALLVATAAVSLGAFTATVTNNANSANTGDLLLSESTSGSTPTTCVSTATGGSTTPGSVAITTNSSNCNVNLFAGLSKVGPGNAAAPTTMAFKNTGSVNATAFTLGLPSTYTACATATANAALAPYYGSDSGTTNLCNLVDVTIENDTVAGSPTCIFPASTSACPTLSGATTTDLASLYSYLSTAPVSLGTLAAGSSDTIVFTLGLSSSATNADQALSEAFPLTWELSA